ncbi:Gaa1-domain-containing protein [Piromyces finnis]|uniref:Gaa1-domain-containing protein n=1 Tax=Piromyces finnis TaxID=1754191 RepID=A0A1Y1V351_9FUNG|nr:Gaa1-domain-containing protein [Piromyces finnis]|eukprot:ORX46231.1 Gaa1-domain-containing protein [Piromyces finnis]
MGLGLIHNFPLLFGKKTIDKNIAKIQRKKKALITFQKILKKTFILYIIGIIWLLILPSKIVHNTSKTQENALLAGQVNTYYSNSEVNLEMEYAEKLKNITFYQQFIKEEMEKYGLLSEIQNFSYNSSIGNMKINGANVYGLFKSPRSDGTESLVLSAPWTCSKDELNTHGVAFLLSLMRYFIKQAYWAKDLIFIVYDHNTVGASAWLQSYHSIHDNDIKYEPLTFRSGVIQEAINLELCSQSGSFSSLGLYFEGSNGQLPNLDIVNTVFKLANSVRIPISIFDSTVRRYQRLDDKTYYKECAKNLLRTAKHQLHGIPLKAHGVFVKYKIDAITLHGNNHKKERSSFGIKPIGTYTEGLVRSFNNLLEKLHHSNHFYMIPYSGYILDVGYFYPPVVLLVAFLTTNAYLIWLASGDKDPLQPLPVNVKSVHIYDANKPKGILIDTFPAFSRRDRPVIQATSIIILTFVCGALCYFIPYISWKIINIFNLSKNMLFSLTVILSLVLIVGILKPSIPFIRTMLIPDEDETPDEEISKQPKSKEPVPDWHLIKCISCCLLCCVLSTFGLISYGLSVLFGLISTPVYSFIQPTKNRFLNVVQFIELIIVSPVGILFIASYMAKLTPNQLYLNLIHESELYGTWILPFIYFFYLPINICHFIILSSHVKNVDKSIKKD